MPESAKPSQKPTDTLYLAAFALGMLFFWAAGHAGVWLESVRPGLNFAYIVAVSSLVYAAGAKGVVYFLAGRKLRPTLIAALAAFVLAPLLSWGIGAVAAGHVHSQVDLGLYNFVLYAVYGTLYVLILALGRKLAGQALNFDVASDTPHNK